jgi:hypothetical protein
VKSSQPCRLFPAAFGLRQRYKIPGEPIQNNSGPNDLAGQSSHSLDVPSHFISPRKDVKMNTAVRLGKAENVDTGCPGRTQQRVFKRTALF